MSALLLYLLKVTLINALMLGFYHFSIRPGRNFKLMRAVLLLAITLPLLLPLIPQSLIYPENTRVPVYVFTLPETTDAVTITPRDNQNLIPLLQNTIYLTFATLLMLGTILSILSVIRKYINARKKPTPYGLVLLDDAAKSPYSFFQWVFFSEEGLVHPAADWLLRHEFSHVRHGHSYDRLLSAVFRSFFWFSPFAHLNHKLLAEVHEYQADADAIRALGDKSTYSNLIVSFAGIPGHNSMTNPFSAHLKKRMMMINHLKPGKLNLMRIAAGVILLAAFSMLSSMVKPSDDKKNSPSETTKPVFLAEDPSGTATTLSLVQVNSEPATPDDDTIQPAVFQGGEKARIRFFQENIRYPAEARNQNIQGTVQYKITIETDGKVTSPSIISGIGGGCDEEVLRVAALMPAWKPAMKDGKPVRTSVILPISFKLSNGDEDKEEAQIYRVVEQSPEFPGGEEARIAYMQKAISYPEQARKNKIEGTIYISFVVEKDGSITNALVVRGIGGGCDEIALSAIQQMPTWKPGMEKGKPVRVQFNMPVKFTLAEKEKNKDAAYTEPVNMNAGEDEVFVVVENSPQFPGGDDARSKYLANLITYPVEARNKGIQGTVYVTFIVEKDGTVSNVRVLRGVHKSLDEEAIRVVKNMPAWKPGMQSGKPVRVQYNIPLKFTLGQNEKK